MKKTMMLTAAITALCLLAGCSFTRRIDIHATGLQTRAESDKIFNIFKAVCKKYQLTKTTAMKPQDHIYIYSKKVGINTIFIVIDMTDPENIVIKPSSYPNSKMHSLVPKIAKDIEQELNANGIKYTTSREGAAIAINN